MKNRIIVAVAANVLAVSAFFGTVFADNEIRSELSVRHAYEPFNNTELYQAPHASDTVIFAKRNTLSLYGSENENDFLQLGLSDIEELNISGNSELSLFSENVSLYRAHTDNGVEETVDMLENRDDIIYAEPEYLYYTQEFESAQDNKESTDQWYLDSVGASSAWNYIGENGGSSDTVIAVIDTGVDYTHDDLAHAMWVNPGEIPGNGIDDDGNGYVDDVHGCSTVSGSIMHSGDPMDDHGHGTHVAGIIGMQPDNGTGGTGIAYGCRIMAVKAGQASGVFSSVDIAEAIEYARSMGADIINMSFGSYAESELVKAALERAMSSCVLVAAAGNDGLPALPHEEGRNMYPAAYNWVIGVMASERDSSISSFSNFDSFPNRGGEYEIYAPGSDIYSTLPGNRYAVWSGTSMAAPMVSAAAALLRSEYSDKALYSSRFIMSQLVGSGGIYASTGLDIYEALINKPQPGVIYNRFYVFDSDQLSDVNDNDGIVDAGETVDIAVVLKNKGAEACNVSVTMDALVNGMENKYVDILEDSVDYGNIGVFGEDDNGIIYDSDGEPSGISSPFRIKVSSETPNDTVINLNITITAHDSADPSASKEYVNIDKISFVVQNGRELGGVISEDMTLTNDHYWIINRSVRIEPGVTVNVEPGTQIQFWSSKPLGVYDELKEVYIIVDGRLNINGTEAEPVEMFPGTAFANYPVHIKGNAYIRYANIQNPSLDVAECDHIYGVQTFEYLWCNVEEENRPKVHADRITNSRIKNLARNSSVYVSEPAGADCVLLDNSASADFEDENGFTNCVFLISPQLPGLGIHLDEYSENAEFVSINNAILGRNIDPNPNNWIRMRYNRARGYDIYFPYNYWGTVSEEVIDKIVIDQDDDLSKGKIYYEPFLSEPAESTYPCVSDISIYDSGGNEINVAGLENITVKIGFNRDMNTNVQPMVSFGPSEPYTDFVLSGDWQDSRTWVGKYGIKPSLGDGKMYFRVEGAVEANDPWLVTGNDWGRYQFEISTTDAEAMVLQVSAGEKKIDLSWMQDDYETLAGYNVYRATDYGNGYLSYSKINDTLIPKDVTTFTDTKVNPNYTYYYKFTVVLTDFTETDASPGVAARLLDGIPPTIAHTPLKSSAANADLMISADITDNEQVETAVIFYRQEGSERWESVTMQHGADSIYFGTVPAAFMTANIEYYIEASDGTSISRSGTSDSPYLILVDDTPHISSFSPGKAYSSGGDEFVIQGVNFTEGIRVYIGDNEATDVKLESGMKITGILPPNAVGAYDVMILSSDGRTDTLANAITVIDDNISLQIVSAVGKYGDDIYMPIIANNASGITSMDVSLKYNLEQLALTNVIKAEETENCMLEYNDDNGLVRISMASADTFMSNAELCILHFKIKDDAVFTRSYVDFDSALINGSNIGAISGSVIIEDVYNVSGQVSYYSHGGAVGNTDIVFGNGIKARTDKNGSFVKRGLQPGKYTVTASKEDGFDSISAYDAALTLQKSVGKRELEGGSAVAADVNMDGSINSVDASLILKAASGKLKDVFGISGALWSFRPPSIELGLDSDKNIGFTAVELGDVSGNWGVNSVQSMDLAENSSQTYHAPEGCVSIEIPVYSDKLVGFDDMIGVDIKIDISRLNYKSIEAVLPQSIEEGCLIEQSITDGILTVAIMSSSPILLRTDEPIITLNIELNEKFSNTMQIRVVQIQCNETEILSDTDITIAGLEVDLPHEMPAYGDRFHVLADCLKTDIDMSSAVMYTAAYDTDGTLLKLWMSQYRDRRFSIEETMSVDADSIRVFLWDNKNMKPLIESVEMHDSVKGY